MYVRTFLFQEKEKTYAHIERKSESTKWLALRLVRSLLRSSRF